MSPRTVTAALALLLAIPGALQAQIGVNLIANPGGEAGPGDTGGYTVVTDVPGWVRTGSLNVVRYGAPDFPNASSPGAPQRGLNFFAGGPTSAVASASQEVGIADLAGPADAAELTAALSGWLGGYSSQGDNAVVRVEFLGSDSSVIGEFSIGPVTNAERGNTSGMLFRQNTAPVPPQTRKVRVTIQMTRLAGSYNDGYADELSLVLTAGGTPRRYFTRARDLTHITAWFAREGVRFSIAGRVTQSGTDWFDIQDASGIAVRVLATGHGAQPGDMLLVTGRLSAQTPVLTLETTASAIVALP